MAVEAGNVFEALPARRARRLEGLLQLQRRVFGVDVGLDARVRLLQHSAGGARVPALALGGQVPHAPRVRRPLLLLALLRAHAGARGRGPAPAALAVPVHAVVVSAVEAPIVLQELRLRLEWHAVAEAAEVEDLHPPAVLVGAVPSDRGLFEELLGAVAAREPLEAVAPRVAAVRADGLLRVEDVLAHPAHPGALRAGGAELRGAGGSGAGGGPGVGGVGGGLLGEFFLGEVGVPAVVVRHVRQDVLLSRHLDLACAAVEQEVGEVRPPVEAAHVEAGDGRLLHVFAADAALVENLVGGQQVLPGGGLLGEAEAALAAPAHRRPAAALAALAPPPPFSRVLPAAVPLLVGLPGSRVPASLLLPPPSALALRLAEPAVLQDGSLHGPVDLHAVLGRLPVAGDFGLAEEELAAEGALASHPQPLHHLRHRLVGLGHGAALSAVHAGGEREEGKTRVRRRARGAWSVLGLMGTYLK